MGLPNEQREKMNRLISASRTKKISEEISRIKEQIRNELPDFDKRYKFADNITKVKISEFIEKLPYSAPSRPDLSALPRRTEFYGHSGRVWICFLSGSREIFDIFISCEISDFFKDYDDWYFFSAYLLLLYEDFSGFIYIDDDKNETEVLLETKEEHS